MEIIKKFEIYSLPNFMVLKSNFEKYKYQTNSIEKIVKKLQKDKGYNIRIKPDEPCIIYGDYDHSTLQQFEKFLKFLCFYFEIKIDDISYTSSKNNTSFHYSIPSIETTPNNLKAIFEQSHYDEYRKSTSEPGETCIDLSVYCNHWFRLPEQTLSDKPIPHKIIRGKIEDFIFSYTDNAQEILDPIEKVVKISETKPEHKFGKDKSKEEYIARLIDLLDYSRANDYDNWLNISFIINNELGKEGLSIFQNFSKQSKKYDSNKDDKWYLDLEQNESGLFIGSLINYVKEDNLEEYQKLKKEFIKEPINKIELKFEHEQDIAKYIISKYLEDKYICVSTEKEEFYYYNGNLWTKDHSNITIFKYITNDYVNELYEVCKSLTNKSKSATNNEEKEDTIKKTTSILKTISKLKGKIAGVKGIISWISHILFNPKFYDLCDENIYLLGFDNGVYDTRTKEFRDGKPDDYITKSVGFDFPTKSGKYKKDIETFFNQIYPNENVRKYSLQQIAQTLSGKKGKDIVFTHTGRGGNGKSILQSLLKYTYGDYYVEIPSTMLTKQNKMEHNKPDPFFTELKGCRMGTANEPPDGSEVNDSFIKIIGSKEGVKYRTLFSNIVDKLNIQFQLNIYCNNKLKFNAEDGGVVRRLKVIDYISKFDETPDENNNIYKIDCELSEKVKNWRQDYMFMLLNLYDPNYIYTEPNEIKVWSSNYADSNNDVLKFIQQNYEQTNNNNDFICLKDIKLLYQQNKEFNQLKLKTMTESLQKLLNTNIKERHRYKDRDYRSVFLGWQLKEDDKESPLDKL